MPGFPQFFNRISHLRKRVSDVYINASGINGALRLPNAIKYKRKIKELQRDHCNEIKKFAMTNSDYLESSRLFLKQNFRGYRDISWHLCYSWANGILDEMYIPEDLFYRLIEQQLNEISLAAGLADKNAYQIVMRHAPTPQTAFRIIRGRLLDSNYQPMRWDILEKTLDPATSLILKPAIGTGGGKGISIDSAANMIARVKSELSGSENPVKLNYISQHYLTQNQSIAKLHPSSLNTVRTMTFRNQDRIVLLSSVLRMGRNQMKVDNQHAGGLACGINAKGYLKKFAYDKHFNRFAEHPDTHVCFDKFQLPGYHDVVELCIALHGKLQMFDLISWDMAVDEASNPCMIEFNLHSQEINFHQTNNGPLFGSFTPEMIERLSLV
jgi:hypothetical protein